MPEKRLTDSELRRKLIELGQDVGPITDSTRKLYERKLDQLLSGNKQDEKKNRRRSAPLHPVRKPDTPQSSLIGFSSEESDLDYSDSGSRHRRRRTLPPSNFSSSASNTNEVNALPNYPSTPEFKTPLPKSPKGSANSSSLLSGEMKRSSLRSSKRLSLNNSSREPDTSDSDLDIDKHLLGNKSRRSLGGLSAQFSSANSFDASITSSPLSLNLKNRQNSSTRSSSSTLSKAPPLIQANGQRKLDKEEDLEWEFLGDDDAASTGWQHVPHLLLAVVASFFAIVGLLYLGVRQNDPRSHSLATYGFSDFVCKGFTTENCVPKENLELALIATRYLHSVLSERAGQFECEPGKFSKKSLTFQEAKRTLLETEDFEDERAVSNIFESCIYLMEKNPDWGLIVLKDSMGAEEALESQTARKGLGCRVYQAFQRVFNQVCLAVAVIMGGYGCFIVVNYRRQKKRIFEKQLFELVEKILETLQQNQENAGLEKDSYLPIVHVRDMLIPLSERKNKGTQKLWEAAVKFLESNESRIRMEQQRVAGEDFMVWRWMQPTSPYPLSTSSSPSLSGDSETRRSKVWQGQAFGTGGKGSNVLPFCPTPCLKIRNMFDPEVEFGTDWPHYIRDAILEKCEHIGILHIHVDASSKEGCVFMKCNTQETAGQAYRALHGWWFDGNLVTVKYLRVERYYERFPDARTCTTFLKPSNNLKLSMHPLHCS